jgi:hypothetical protein
VLEVVGEAELVLCFLEGAGGDDKAEGGAFAGFGVGAEGVAETVGQFAYEEGGIGDEAGGRGFGGGREKERGSGVGVRRNDQGKGEGG